MNADAPPLIVRRYAEVRAAMLDARFVIHKPLAGAAGQTGPSSEHSRRVAPLSAVLAAHLSAKRLGDLSGYVSRQIERQLSAGLERGGMDLVADLAYPVPVRVMMELLGLPPGDEGPLAPLLDAVTAGHDLGSTDQDRIKARFALTAIGTWIRDRMSQSAPTPLQQAILTKAESDGIPDTTVIYWMTMLLYAGSTTTRDFLVNVVVALLERPEAALALAGAPPAVLKTALEELLRLEGPVRMVGRMLREPVVLQDNSLPTNTVVYLDLEQANRDPSQFTDPLELRLDRSPNPHLAFGTGITFCLGSHLARMESLAVLQAVVPLLPRMELLAPPKWGDSRVLRERRQASVGFS